MLRAEQLGRLRHHRLVDGDLLRLGLEEFRGIGDHAQAHRHLAAGRGQIDVLRVAAGIHRRVDQDVERHVFVIDRVAVRPCSCSAVNAVQPPGRSPADRT
jgi:sugar phosphate isomerase/epimerase